jgi:hypothetical protein
VRRAATLFVTALLALTGSGIAGSGIAGCGFVGSGERGSSKPDAFTLHGYVSVGVAAPATDVAPPASAVATGGAPSAVATGGACEAPAAANDVHAGGPVRVADPAGHTLAAGELSPGVRDATSARCNFGFQVSGVPGGVDSYVIGVGNRPAASFPAQDLRSGKPAVIVVDV